MNHKPYTMKTITKTPAVQAEEARFNTRHEIFAEEMATHGNKTRAYQTAYPGTSEESARAAASRLLASVDMQARIREVYKTIHIGLRKDREAFIYQECKIIDEKRKYLLELISGQLRYNPTITMKAIKMDNDLVEKQMQLLGYGDLKRCTEFAADKYEQWQIEEQVATWEEKYENDETSAETQEASEQEKTEETVTKCNIPPQPARSVTNTLVIPLIDPRLDITQSNNTSGNHLQKLVKNE